MEEQSDTPRSGVLVPSDELKRLQRERDELQAKVAELVENGERLKAVADAAVRDAADMAEAKCAPLRDQIHQLRFDQQWAFDLVYRIRQALGDNGKLMQDELIEHAKACNAARAECIEQARLLDMSATREAALLAKVDAITRERDEARAEVKRLLGVLLDQVPHAYEGNCPDSLDPTQRDPNCRACQLLAATEAKP